MEAMKHIIAIFLITMSAVVSAQDVAKPVRVFILADQSNMEGAGQIKADPKRNGGQGSLEFLVKDAATAKLFAPLVYSAGHWRTRDDVWISYLDRKGPLTVGFGARKDEIVEHLLGFGIGCLQILKPSVRSKAIDDIRTHTTANIVIGVDHQDVNPPCQKLANAAETGHPSSDNHDWSREHQFTSADFSDCRRPGSDRAVSPDIFGKSTP